MLITAADVETHLMRPGAPAPRLVCGSWATGAVSGVMDRRECLDRFEGWFRAAAKGELVLVFANAPYDLGVLVAERPRLLKFVFAALDRGTIRDIFTRQALIDIARGCLYKDYETGKKLVDPETGKTKDRYSLAIISMILRGVRVEKADTWRLRYGELDGVPIAEWPEDARTYPIKDATETLANYEVQEGGPNLDEAPRTDQANFALHLLRMRGIRTDPSRVEPLAAEVRKRHAESRRRFLAEGIISVKTCEPDGEPDEITEAELIQWERDAEDPKPFKAALKRLQKGGTLRFCENRKRLQQLVFDAYLGEPPRTDKGSVQADRDAMKESGDALLEEYAAAGEDEKLYGTFIPALEQGVVYPINSEWNVLVETGRTSCRKPNLQNLPRGMDGDKLAARIREAFVPRVGSFFCSVDFSAIEMVTLAQTCLWLFGWSRLADALKDGKKPHELLAARMLRIPYEEMCARYKAGDKEAKIFRQFAKIGNFGLAGGMGADKLVRSARQQGVKFCEARGAEKCGVVKELDRQKKPICVECRKIAQEIRAAYLEQWEEMALYFALVSRETDVEGGGSVQVLPDGIVVGRRNYTAAANLKFQGLAARLAKAALWDVTKECYQDRFSPLWGSRPVLFVHDEIIAEVPIDKAHAAAQRLAEVMLASVKRHCPDVPCEAKPALARRWYKAMESCFVDNVLVPWEPQEKAAA